MIRIEALEIGYSEKTILLKVPKFEFARGERIALVGKNGAGKSTFLKTLCGLMPAIKGDIFFNAKSIYNCTLHERARFVSYFKALSPPGFQLTVRDLIYMYPNSIPKTSLSKTKHDIIIKALGLNTVYHTPLSQLSDGWNQKALIARACIQDSPYIIMDEPTHYLDVFARQDFFELLQHLTQEFKITILFSTHDLESLPLYADRIICISNTELLTYSNAEWANFGCASFFKTR